MRRPLLLCIHSSILVWPQRAGSEETRLKNLFALQLLYQFGEAPSDDVFASLTVRSITSGQSVCRAAGGDCPTGSTPFDLVAVLVASRIALKALACRELLRVVPARR